MKSLNKDLARHLKTAKLNAEQSYAKRLRVGCVIAKDGRTVSEGRNGMPAGGSNNCEIYVQDGPGAELVTKPEVKHAEVNAIGYAARDGRPTKDCILVTTHSPCFECAKLIEAAGIKHVYYETEYRLTDSLKFLRSCGIKVTKIGEL